MTQSRVFTKLIRGAAVVCFALATCLVVTAGCSQTKDTPETVCPKTKTCSKPCKKPCKKPCAAKKTTAATTAEKK